jgi:hypothetical protein
MDRSINMVFVINLKWLSFKQDLSKMDRMLEDQVSTYAILRYAFDIPDRVYRQVMDQLSTSLDEIYYRKLHKLVSLYANVSNAGLKEFEEEFIETIEIKQGYDGQGMILSPVADAEDGIVLFGLHDDEEDAIYI